jgi:hypothetical protein
MKTSDNVDKIIPAFIAFQADMPSVPKDGNNPHFKSKYATLGAITEATRPHLAKHGLGYTQFMSNKDGYQLIVTRIMHTSGQWMEDDGYILNPTKNDPQGMGSAVTYARRYTLGASLGIITEDDDDGNKASAPQATPPVKLAPIPKVTKPMPDWFNDNGELNDLGKKAGEAISNGMKWSDIEKKYHIDTFTRGVVDAYASSLKNASQILEQADAMESDGTPFG